MAQNPNIDDATRARAMKFVADKTTPAKQRIVSKKELENSGLSLRDFLNKERGLTRRKEVDPTAGEAKDRASQIAADSVDPGSPSYKSSRPPEPSFKIIPGTRVNEENKDVTDMSTGKRGGMVKKMAGGGSVSSRADGIAQRGKTRGMMV